MGEVEPTIPTNQAIVPFYRGAPTRWTLTTSGTPRVKGIPVLIRFCEIRRTNSLVHPARDESTAGSESIDKTNSAQRERRSWKAAWYACLSTSTESPYQARIISG